MYLYCHQAEGPCQMSSIYLLLHKVMNTFCRNLTVAFIQKFFIHKTLQEILAIRFYD